MRKIVVAFCLMLLGIFAFGQQSDNTSSSEGAQLFYRTELYVGAFLHTNGLGVNIRKSNRITGYTKRVFGLDLMNLKHAKEFKSFNPYVEDNRGFVYGKLNSVIVARPYIAHQKIWYTKDVKKGVQISYLFAGGPVLAFQKPIYLEVADFSSSSRFGVAKTEKFDPEKHSYDNIYGRAPMLKGIEETTVLPGLSTKLALNFDYATDDQIYRALEAGVNLDAYISDVQLMAFDTNRQVYFTLFINLFFGKKEI